MKIEKFSISEKIPLLVFENQFDITSTLLRFQEHYESPKFRGKIFTLDEYKKWYSETYGKFSYYEDWNGFNFPSNILNPFYEGLFDPLSEKEEQILDLFKDERDDFYTIGVHKNTKYLLESLCHEISHGLFFTDKKYRSKVRKILSNPEFEFDLFEIKYELFFNKGYHLDVLEDEVHAYSLDLENGLKTKIPRRLYKKLLKNYEKALDRNNVIIPNFLKSNL